MVQDCRIECKEIDIHFLCAVLPWVAGRCSTVVPCWIERRNTNNAHLIPFNMRHVTRTNNSTWLHTKIIMCGEVFAIQVESVIFMSEISFEANKAPSYSKFNLNF